MAVAVGFGRAAQPDKAALNEAVGREVRELHAPGARPFEKTDGARSACIEVEREGELRHQLLRIDALDACGSLPFEIAKPGGIS